MARGRMPKVRMAAAMAGKSNQLKQNEKPSSSASPKKGDPGGPTPTSARSFDSLGRGTDDETPQEFTGGKELHIAKIDMSPKDVATALLSASLLEERSNQLEVQSGTTQAAQALERAIKLLESLHNPQLDFRSPDYGAQTARSPRKGGRRADASPRKLARRSNNEQSAAVAVPDSNPKDSKRIEAPSTESGGPKNQAEGRTNDHDGEGKIVLSDETAAEQEGTRSAVSASSSRKNSQAESHHQSDPSAVDGAFERPKSASVTGVSFLPEPELPAPKRPPATEPKDDNDVSCRRPSVGSLDLSALRQEETMDLGVDDDEVGGKKSAASNTVGAHKRGSADSTASAGKPMQLVREEEIIIDIQLGRLYCLRGLLLHRLEGSSPYLTERELQRGIVIFTKVLTQQGFLDLEEEKAATKSTSALRSARSAVSMKSQSRAELRKKSVGQAGLPHLLMNLATGFGTAAYRAGLHHGGSRPGSRMSGSRQNSTTASLDEELNGSRAGDDEDMTDDEVRGLLALLREASTRLAEKYIEAAYRAKTNPRVCGAHCRTVIRLLFRSLTTLADYGAGDGTDGSTLMEVVRTLVLLGKAYLLNNMYEEALSCGHEALERAPNDKGAQTLVRLVEKRARAATTMVAAIMIQKMFRQFLTRKFTRNLRRNRRVTGILLTAVLGSLAMTAISFPKPSELLVFLGQRGYAMLHNNLSKRGITTVAELATTSEHFCGMLGVRVTVAKQLIQDAQAVVAKKEAEDNRSLAKCSNAVTPIDDPQALQSSLSPETEEKERPQKVVGGGSVCSQNVSNPLIPPSPYQEEVSSPEAGRGGDCDGDGDGSGSTAARMNSAVAQPSQQPQADLPALIDDDLAVEDVGSISIKEKRHSS